MTGRTVTRLIGVYNAKGTALGELSYVIGRATGKAQCALCDITHGRLRPRREWEACRGSLGIPFETFHSDDQPEAARLASNDRRPVVLAETDDGQMTVLMNAAELDACGPSPDELIKRIGDRLRTMGLIDN